MESDYFRLTNYRITPTHIENRNKSFELPLNQLYSNSQNIKQPVLPLTVQLIPHKRPKSQLRIRIDEYIRHDQKSKETIQGVCEIERLHTEPPIKASFFNETEKSNVMNNIREYRLQFIQPHDPFPHKNVLNNIRVKQSLFKQRRKFVENRANSAMNQMINKTLFSSFYDDSLKTEPPEPSCTNAPLFVSPKSGPKFDPTLYPVKPKKLVLPDNTPSYGGGMTVYKLDYSSDEHRPQIYQHTPNSPSSTMKRANKKKAKMESNFHIRSLYSQKVLHKIKNTENKSTAFQDAYLPKNIKRRKPLLDLDSDLSVQKVDVKPYSSELEARYKFNTSNVIITNRNLSPDPNARAQTSHGRQTSPSKNVLALRKTFYAARNRRTPPKLRKIKISENEQDTILIQNFSHRNSSPGSTFREYMETDPKGLRQGL